MISRFLGQVDASGASSASAKACQTWANDSQFLYDDGGLLVACDARIPHGGPNVAQHIASAWQQWRTDCPLHLYGDYSFFVHDRASGESFCARDHIGARPLFFANSEEMFFCANDIPSLLALPGVSQELDEEFLAASQTERFFEPGDGSFYRSIRRLTAGHCLHRTNREIRIWRWWQPENLPVRGDISDAEAVAETRRLLKAAVTDRLDKASKVGLHLSGGIDSSLVAAFVVARTTKVQSYCWQDLAATDAGEPEAEWIEAIRAHLGLSLSAPKLSPAEMALLLARDWTQHPDARNLLHEAAVQRDAATSGVTQIFSGWGGDEGLSFHGRGHKPWLFATGRWRELWRIAEAPGLRGRLAEFYSAIVRLWRDFGPLPSRRRQATAHSLLDPAFARRVKLRPELRFREFGLRKTQLNLLQKILSSRIEDWAISGAEHGIEYCYPLLDRALLEHILTLPPRMFVREGGRRWLVREVARDLVPELIRTNTSKNEVARGRQLDSALAEAYGEIARMLRQRSGPPGRAQYLDMATVSQRLAKAIEYKSGRDKQLRLAIQLLDLE